MLFCQCFISEITNLTIKKLPQFWDLVINQLLDPFIILICRFFNLLLEWIYLWVNKLFHQLSDVVFMFYDQHVILKLFCYIVHHLLLHFLLSLFEHLRFEITRVTFVCDLILSDHLLSSIFIFFINIDDFNPWTFKWFLISWKTPRSIGKFLKWRRWLTNFFLCLRLILDIEMLVSINNHLFFL